MMFEGKLKVAVCFFGLLLTMLLVGPIRADMLNAAPPKVSARLQAIPGTFQGDCPVTITFKGWITVGGACTVKFKFLRSDGVEKPTQEIIFASAGSKVVTDHWTLNKDTSGWEVIEVAAPIQVKSNQAGFTVFCKPHIDSVIHKHLGFPTGEFDIIGKQFGATQGTRKVRVDGTMATSYLAWQDTYLSINLPVPYIPWEHIYQFCIVDGANNVISNLYSKRFLYHCEDVIPHEGPIGTRVRFPVYKLPSPLSGLVLKIGTRTMKIISWTAGGYGEIVTSIPIKMPLGDHFMYLQKGSDVVSNKVKFRVTSGKGKIIGK
jgi:hypothetical protein